MIDYKQLQTLAAILEEDSFDKAATRLHISQSAVSQRLKQLEDTIGQTLILRSNPIQVTTAGQQLLKHYRQISLLQRELFAELSQKQADGYTRIAIGLNADSLATWFLDAVQPLLQKEKILFELKVDDQDQTHHLLKSGQVIGCISSNPKPMQGCNCIPLGIVTYRFLASPEYVARYFPDGINREGFLQAPVAEFSNKDELQNRYLQTFFNIAANEYPKHRIPSTESFFQMVIRGLACGMIPDQQSREPLDNGKVVDLSPGQYIDVPLYWHVWNLKSDLYRQLTHALTRVASKELSPFKAE
ncbi:MAG: ArgP/LysG family DNA-binding transcriptional regulator [Neptuniibacter caesariensis]|uniref:ArgP/LysG family DNA-binding transcriptional regulator n=1 Tax=Neptuniibacter caesariensis TaxID=207954 RepID=A0A2G6JPM7_NEPCE|nr:MAG: ArgP/LysG family DNA-binding transcriptional regulator [Neptuniibacter caesariensis]